MWVATCKSAEISERALTDLERPYIFIWGIVGFAPAISYGPLHGGFSQQVIQQNASFIYSVSNKGKLAARIENVSIGCGYESGGQPPPLRIMGDHFLLSTPLISAEQDIKNIPYDVPWRELDRTNPDPSFRNGLIFRMVIKYRGPFTQDHETGQAWRYIDAVNGWVEDPRYTYSRQRNQPERN